MCCNVHFVWIYFSADGVTQWPVSVFVPGILYLDSLVVDCFESTIKLSRYKLPSSRPNVWKCLNSNYPNESGGIVENLSFLWWHPVTPTDAKPINWPVPLKPQQSIPSNPMERKYAEYLVMSTLNCPAN